MKYAKKMSNNKFENGFGPTMLLISSIVQYEDKLMIFT